MNTIGIYLRLSKDDGKKDESNSITNQRKLIYDYIEKHTEFKNYDIIEFLDDGVSGTTFDRKGVKELLSLCGVKINCIIVKDFSRFGRNPIDNIEYLDVKFPSLNVRFISINENYDSFAKENVGSTLSLDYAFKNLANGLYSKRLSEEIKTVKRNKLNKGILTNPRIIYGLKVVDGDRSKITIDEEPAKVIQRIFDMRLNGTKAKDIAITLNEENVLTPFGYRYPNINEEEKTLWSTKSITKILKDERYKGTHTALKREKILGGTQKERNMPREDWIIIENHHPEIVSPEIFEKVQLTFIKHKNRIPYNKRETNNNNIFLGIIFCKSCNKRLIMNGVKKPNYFCSTGKSLQTASCSSLKIDFNNLKIEVELELQKEIKSLIKRKNNVSKKLINLKELDYDIAHLLINSVVFDVDSSYIINWNYDNFM